VFDFVLSTKYGNCFVQFHVVALDVSADRSVLKPELFLGDAISELPAVSLQFSYPLLLNVFHACLLFLAIL
jgi:hypothetical protein